MPQEEMTEEEILAEEELEDGANGSTQEEDVETQQVTLSAEQYNALLDRVTELESTPSADGMDHLIKEGQSPYQEGQTFSREKEVDYEELSNTQLMGEINRKLDQRDSLIQTEVQTLKLLREVDQCEQKHDDFYDYQKEIYDIAVQNPNLNIEQVYTLAKATGGKKEVEGGKKEKLLTLPPRAVFGSGSSIAPGATKSNEKVFSLKDAAEKAWAEDKKNSKE